MEFTQTDLVGLAEQFEKKAEQFLETASSIRESASIMTGGPTTDATTGPAFAEVEARPPEFEVTIRLVALTPLAKAVVRALWGAEHGVEVEDVVAFCKTHVGRGTMGSVRHVLAELGKQGFVVRIRPGLYRLVERYLKGPDGKPLPVPPVIQVEGADK
jgi:hypothetical protein